MKLTTNQTLHLRKKLSEIGIGEYWWTILENEKLAKKIKDYFKNHTALGVHEYQEILEDKK